MSTSSPWLSNFRKAIKLGLAPLYKEPPQTAVEWADADNGFYMSAESSYQEGKWITDPVQRAILNCMGNDLIRTLNLIKSARVGYTKLLVANIGYKIQHKRRNVLAYTPTDPDSEEFSKRHINGLIRDAPLLLELAPWFGRKHADNTINAKRFANRKMLWCLGGKAARNYREKSADEVIYDELSKFDASIEGEGSPTSLGDRRLQGATNPKSIRGSTPGIAGPCQITKAVEESPHLLRYNIACPCCGGEQVLLWGGKDCAFGIKWETDKLGQASKAWYVCAHKGCEFYHHQMVVASETGRWICEKTGIWTRDGMDWFDQDDEPCGTPQSVSFHIWTAYSTRTTWLEVVEDWLKVKGDREKLITFVNTVLGEVWEEDQGEKVDWELLYGRREVYPEVPMAATALMGGIDTQDDRLEGRVWAFGPGEESWLVHRFILNGDPGSEELRRKVGLQIHKQFTRADGLVMRVERWCWDAGGHYSDEVAAESRKHGAMWVIPTFGASTYGKMIANFPRKKKDRIYKTEIGTDNAKELIYSRLRIAIDVAKSKTGEAQPGAVHFPANDDICDEDELKQLTAEKKKSVISKGKRVLRWDAGGKRNEALDCFVLAIAALRISQQRFGLDLDALAVKPEPGGEAAVDNTKERPRAKSSYWKKN
ncbi:phage terminase large subunit family protein [Pseudomonas sp. 2023EL-01195]|uniref:phage terminase large subunit family protein n=1 Tax=Pseudomonas sp. 2023EL-01195 TaxID=3088134 RepID=UPI00296B4050|nr:terminase gpA endonuclease subunit [Pseudomonas sp. 2023EL-01195]MDW3716708.1 terminase gpA endonuclease subunit [Pseudomonas sp. 2023EL-01195]